MSYRLARDMEKDERGYPPELWQKMAGLGWLGMGVPSSTEDRACPLPTWG